MRPGTLGCEARLVLMLCALPLAASAQQVRQVADSTFVPTVAVPAFTKHHPRVLFDEAHHNFHTPEGRYQAFGAVLKADGCELTPNRESFSARSLEGFDVLVIANALAEDPESASGSKGDSTAQRRGSGADSTARRFESKSDSIATPSAFGAEEIEAVYRWVNDGGALLLVADHTPFGSAAAALSARFGVNMSQGYAVDSLQAAGSITNLEFTRAKGTLGDHPIMNGWGEKERINRVVAFTGQSLLGPAGSTPLMKLSDAAVDIPPEALKLSNDPKAMMSKAVPAKGRSMAVALQVGRGRVVVQGEAGMLAAQIVIRAGHEPYKFGMNQPGLDNQQYARNLIGWLAERMR